jgi:hypothetical protein
MGAMVLEVSGIPEWKQENTSKKYPLTLPIIFFLTDFKYFHTVPCKAIQSPKELFPSEVRYLN